MGFRIYLFACVQLKVTTHNKNNPVPGTVPAFGPAMASEPLGDIRVDSHQWRLMESPERTTKQKILLAKLDSVRGPELGRD